MTGNELSQLNGIIKNIAQRTIDTNNQICYIYTVKVQTVNDDNTVTVSFLQDLTTSEQEATGANKTMTFVNLSGYTPTVGQGAYVLTTGGSNITGGFIIALSGQPSAFINALATQISTMQESVTTLQGQMSALQTRVNNIKDDVDELNDAVAPQYRSSGQSVFSSNASFADDIVEAIINLM